jgi:hypothetical protein
VLNNNLLLPDHVVHQGHLLLEVALLFRDDEEVLRLRRLYHAQVPVLVRGRIPLRGGRRPLGLPNLTLLLQASEGGVSLKQLLVQLFDVVHLFLGLQLQQLQLGLVAFVWLLAR